MPPPGFVPPLPGGLPSPHKQPQQQPEATAAAAAAAAAAFASASGAPPPGVMPVRQPPLPGLSMGMVAPPGMVPGGVPQMVGVPGVAPVQEDFRHHLDMIDSLLLE